MGGWGEGRRGRRAGEERREARRERTGKGKGGQESIHTPIAHSTLQPAHTIHSAPTHHNTPTHNAFTLNQPTKLVWAMAIQVTPTHNTHNTFTCTLDTTLVANGCSVSVGTDAHMCSSLRKAVTTAGSTHNSFLALIGQKHGSLALTHHFNVFW